MTLKQKLLFWEWGRIRCIIEKRKTVSSETKNVMNVAVGIYMKDTNQVLQLLIQIESLILHVQEQKIITKRNNFVLWVYRLSRLCHYLRAKPYSNVGGPFQCRGLFGVGVYGGGAEIDLMLILLRKKSKKLFWKGIQCIIMYFIPIKQN